MRVSFHGQVPEGPTVASVGTWDPITADHRAMLQDLKKRAHDVEAVAAVIIMEPSPSAFIQGLDRWIRFEPIESRIDRLLALGIETIGIIAFEESDLAAGAPEFFDLLVPMIAIRELWLGSRQSLGSGAAGSLDRILAEARAHEINIKRLPPSDGFLIASTARRHIGLGQVAAAVNATGLKPTWASDRPGLTATTWPVGHYLAEALDGPRQGEICSIMIASGDSGRWNRICWPGDSCSKYAFLAGPGDTLTETSLAPADAAQGLR